MSERAPVFKEHQQRVWGEAPNSPPARCQLQRCKQEWEREEHEVLGADPAPYARIGYRGRTGYGASSCASLRSPAHIP